MERIPQKASMISQVLVLVFHVNLVDLPVRLWASRCDSLGMLRKEM
jgi:hypothetical protein